MNRFRNEPRFSCDFEAKLTLLGHSAECRITNVSRSGLSAEQCPILRVKAGDKVDISSDKLGYVHGTVRWVGMNHIGLELDTALDDAVLIAVADGDAR